MAKRSQEAGIAVRMPERLAEVLGVRLNDLEVLNTGSSGADFMASVVGNTLMVQFSKSTGAAPIAAAVKNLWEHARRSRRRVVPLLVVPFMGEVGRRLCEEAGVGWMDLSGNANITARGLRVIIEGRPNRFRSAGRPPNLFAPKSSRIARWLLIHHDKPITQRGLANATGLGEGFVSRIVSRLDADGYLTRVDPSGEGDRSGTGLRVRDASLLLEAWREAYQFSRHTIIKGHVATRTGDELLKLLSETLLKEGVEYAATGLAAAWVFNRFAAFRTATVYLQADPAPALLERLGFREEPRGANLWLVVPNDIGVYQDSIEKDGVRCVHPVQAYVDLKGHPERATEAAERLRSELLTWRHDG